MIGKFQICLASFMHLDGLVDWVVESRLVNELRAALQEEGVNIEAGV